MKINRLYAGLGASAVLIAIAALLSNSVAQQATQDTTANQEQQDQNVSETQDVTTQDTNVRQDTVTDQQDATTTTRTQRDATRTQRQDNQRDTGLGGVFGSDVTRHHNAFRASDLMGMNVRGRTGDDNIGSIDDLMISRDGKVNYVAVSFGGFLGIGDKKFAVPMQAIEFVVTDDDAYARIDVSEQTLDAKEGFDQDKWPKEANPAFLQNRSERQVERPTTPGEQQDLTR